MLRYDSSHICGICGLILILLLAAGCGRSLKSGWTNFSAYYNTFYNAKQDYRSGLKQVEKQPVQINPDRPVRPHPAPVLAGEEEFEQAIANAAEMLRRFSDSKWTDDALLLIGKSYYHRQEYFLAIQKFEEVLALPMRSPVKQQAVIWKGRTMLDIASYSEGVSFLEARLESDDFEWSPSYRAEAQMVLAEHYAMLEQWNEAAGLLERALQQVENQKLKGRGYYLLGQLLQKNGDPARAFQAYSNVKRYFPDYEYIYWAEIKRAEVSRLQGNADLAVSIYRSMFRDDKNAERHDEIYFQLGRTYETQGRFGEAEAAYERVLRSATNTNLASSTVLADTYYRMGRMYSEQYGNYEGAAAYFDSSTTLNRKQARTKADDRTGRLAAAYGKYTDLKNEISRIDSLLRLGSLSESDLKSELAVIRQQRKEQAQDSPNRVQQTNNVLINTQEEAAGEPTVSDEGSSVFGFLNCKDAQRVESGRRRFAAVWGDRPLTDNWRRREAISGTSIARRRGPEDPSAANPDRAGQSEATPAGMDVAGIPRTAEAQNKLKGERVNAQYRLGTLFFLSLNQPDSADVYYRRVLDEGSISPRLRAQTLYSLYELSNLQEQSDSAARYKSTILEDYPNSAFARRILNRAEAEQEKGQAQNAEEEAGLRRTFQQLMSRADRMHADSAQADTFHALADTLRTLAVNNPSSPLASHIYLEAIKMYIRDAKRDAVTTSPDAKRDTVQTLGEGVESLRANSTSRKDSLEADSTSRVDLLRAESVNRPPYSGEKWEQVRRYLSEFKELFPGAPQTAKIETWQKMLGPPRE